MARNKEEQFYEDKSNLESRLQRFIQLCQDVDRNAPDELEEAVVNALKECGFAEVYVEISDT